MSDLKPCPLCGSTDIACYAEECGDDYDNVPTFRAVVGCCGCHEEGCDPTYDEEPCFGIEAYFRADHPLVSDCEDPSDCERILERHMADRWNRRIERVCRLVHDSGNHTHTCTSCGTSFDSNVVLTVLPGGAAKFKSMLYCPACGARLEEE